MDGQKPRRYYNRSELAKLLGVTRQTIGEHVKIGNLQLTKMSDGISRIDAADDNNYAYISSKLGHDKTMWLREGKPLPEHLKGPVKIASTNKERRFREPPKPMSEIIASIAEDFGAAPVTTPETTPVLKTEPEETQETFFDIDDIHIPKKIDIRRMQKADIEKFNIYFRAIKERTKGEEMRGELISRAIVSKIFDRVWGVHRAQIRTIPQRLSASIGAALGVDDQDTINKIIQVLETESYAVLETIKRNLQTDLKKIELELAD